MLEKHGINPKLLEQLKGKRSRIVVVDELPDIQLWKPGIDIHNDCEVIVYLSRAHPFYEHIYGKLDSGDDAIVIFH